MTFQEFENIRQNYLAEYKRISKKAYSISGIVAGVIALFIFITTLSSAKSSSYGIVTAFIETITSIIFPALFCFIPSFIIVSFKTRKNAAEYKKAYKSYFVAGSLAQIFTNINYNHEAGFDSSVYGAVMTVGDRRHSNDYMTANYKNINFAQADVHTEKECEDSDGDTYYVTIFKGRFLIFDFDRNFSTNVVVHSSGFNGAKLPQTNGRKFEKIKTESSEFNKHFRFYAQDGVDALYIFDPAFMEKVQNLYTSCGKNLLLTFMDKKLYIAINDGKDSFEAPSFKKPLDEQAEFAKVGNDIKLITNFVDSLDLDHYFKGTTK